MGPQLVETHELVSTRLRASGQLYTKGRQELVELLVSARRPASIAELLELRPRLTQSSLYRNMADLESALVKALGATGFQPSTHRLDVLGTCANCT